MMEWSDAEVDTMPDSSLTKRALSLALKELMEEKPFRKIHVGDICDKCNMNRQSFYYHFKDKYDLVIWIFDSDFLPLFQQNSNDMDVLESVAQVCDVLYRNRSFYRCAFSVQGQNSLNEHMREISGPTLQARLCAIMPGKEIPPFYISFITDAILAAIIRWISAEDCCPPKQFIEELASCVMVLADYVISQYGK